MVASKCQEKYVAVCVCVFEDIKVQRFGEMKWKKEYDDDDKK